MKADPKAGQRVAPLHAPTTARRLALPVLATAALVLGACSSGKPPVAEMAASRAVVQQAGSTDARRYAPVELNAAEDKLRRAEEALKAKDYDDARRLAEQAEADASLAAARARSERANRALKEVGAGMNSQGGAAAQGASAPQGSSRPQGMGNVQEQYQPREVR